MEDTSQDYLTKYREFFEALVKNCDLSNPLLVNNIPKYSLTQSEISGEILHWCLRYLSDRDCPTNLAALLCHKAYLEVIELCNKSPDLCGYKSQEDDYNSLKLVQVTIKKLVELCKGYSDNAMLSMLPPPPVDRLCDPILSVCAIKNGRRKMEDRHVLIQDLHALFNLKDCGSASYYAVFDGHNGTDAATYSCAHLHQFLVENENYPHYPEKALSQAFQQTDERFIDKSKKNMDHLESGTTAVCVLLRPYEKKLYTAWLGDSQAILVSRGGKLKCLVNPHRPSRKDERERIESMGGDVLWLGMYRVNGFLAVSRAIGDKKYKPYVTSEPDIKTINLVGDEEFLVIASDGLWDFINPDVIMSEVYQYIAEKTAPIEDLAKHLVQLAKISSEDNISVVVVFLTDPNSLSGLVSLPSAAKKRKTCPVRTRRLVKHVERRRCEKGMDDVKISVRWPHDHVNQHNGSEATHFTGQDMGPETNVDAVDDMMVPQIVRAKALVDQANTMESNEANNDVADGEVESEEESEEEWNYTPGKENKDSSSEQNLDEQDMSQLNPNAAEFVPIFNSMKEETILASSPMKGAEQNLENIKLPSKEEFYLEISQRPGDLGNLSAAAVVAATSQPSKTEDKTSVKKTSAVGAKKPEVKTAAKTATTAKTTARPTTTTLAAKKPAAATAKAPARPTTTSAKPAAPKPSTPTSKAPLSKPSSKPSTPTSKTSTNPAGSVKSAVTKTSVTGTTKAPLTKTAAPAAAKPKVPSTVAAKPAPKTEVKKEVKTAAPAPRPSSAKLTSSRPSSASSTTKSSTAKPPTTTTTAKPTSTTKPSQVLKSTTTTKAPVASKPAVSKVTAKPSSTTSTLKTATTKTTTTTKATTTTTAAAKTAPATKPKTAAPTVVKKPLANDKSVKETTNLKLSTTKTAVAKKADIKGKTIEKKVTNDSLAQQVPTVTTTNGHNGLINGVTSHDDSSPVEIVDALN